MHIFIVSKFASLIQNSYIAYEVNGKYVKQSK